MKTLSPVLLSAVIVGVFLAGCASAPKFYEPSPAMVDNEKPLAEWTFDEGAGNVLEDKSGNGHNGKIERAAWTESGGRRVLLFDGCDSRVDCGNFLLPSKSGALTFEVWINARSFGREDFGRIIECGPCLLLMHRDYGIEFLMFSKAVYVDVPFKTWIHVTGTYDGAEQKIYVNGVEGAKIKVLASENKSPGLLTIGDCPGRSPKRSFDGLIGHAAVYDRALTSKEIRAHYESGINLREDNIVPPDNLIFNSDFMDGKTSLENWIFKIKSGNVKMDFVKPYPGIDKHRVYIDFRESGAWSLFPKKPVNCVSGGQYTLSANVKRYLGYGQFDLIAKNSKNETLIKIPIMFSRSKLIHEVSAVFTCREDSDVFIGLESSGYSELWIEKIRLQRNDPLLSAYKTGLLLPLCELSLAQKRTGAFLEAEDIVDNTNAISAVDMDGDAKWAVCRVDPYDNPCLFSENTVIKSDSAPEAEGGKMPPLKLSAKGLLPGQYQIFLSDPMRDAEISLNGTDWKLIKGGVGEAELGTLLVQNPFALWLRHAVKTVNNPGPIYVDYIRFMPVYDPQKKPEQPASIGPASKETVFKPTVMKPFCLADTPREKEWIVTGIPFSIGACRTGDVVNLEGVSNLITRPLVSWPDGSVKWMRAEFQADVKTNGGIEWPVSLSRQAVKAKEKSDAVIGSERDFILRSGSMALHVKDGLWDQLTLNGHVIITGSPSVRVTTASGTRQTQLLVEETVVEHAGAHPSLLIRGHLGNKGQREPLAFTARISERAPQTMGISFSVVNESDEKYQPEMGCSPAMPLTELTLVIDGIRIVPETIDWPSGRQRFNGQEQVLLQTGAGTNVAVFQGQWDLKSGTNVLAKGAKTDGWLDLCKDESGLAIGVREFHEKHPKALSVRRSGSGLAVEIGIYPRQNGKVLRYAQGTQLTTDIALIGHDGHLTAETRSSRLASVLHPVFAVLPSEYYCQTGVFGPLSPKKQKRFQPYYDSVLETFEDLTKNHMACGIEDWGDFFDICCYVRNDSSVLWTNMEWGMISSLVLQFISTHDERFFGIAEGAARHFSDIDIIHYSTHPGWKGGSYQHTGDLRVGHQVYGPDFAHAGWPQGLLWVYYMCGDESMRASAMGLADYVVNNMPPEGSYKQNPPFSMWNCSRQTANPLLTLASVYELSPDEKYLRALNRLVDFALRVQDPRLGCWSTPFYEEPVYHRPSPDDSGLLFRGLYAYWQMTGDQRVPKSFNRLESFLMDQRPDDTRKYLKKGYHEVGVAYALAALFSREPEPLLEKGVNEYLPGKGSAGRGMPRYFVNGAYLEGAMALLVAGAEKQSITNAIPAGK